MSTELAKFTEITATAPEVLAKSQTRVANAKQAGENLLAKLVAEMNDQGDEEANSYLVKARKTLELITNERKPITQLLDAVKKEFTTIEADLDPKRAESIVSRIQDIRNKYATWKLEEQKRKEAEAAKIKAVEKEKSDTRAAIEISLANWFNEFQTDSIQTLHDTFNEMALATFEQDKKSIIDWPEVYPIEHFNSFKLSVTTLYLSKDDKIALKVDVSDGKYDEFKTTYKAKIAETKADLVSKMPSKKAELEAIADAEKNNAAEAERLKAEKDKREQAEKDRIAKEKSEADAKAKTEADAKAKAAEMQTLFNVESQTTAKERTGYEIIIKHPAAFGLIFQFWFEKEGKDLPIDQLEKKTLGQMKSFCEKYAHKNNETITSPYIQYKEEVKVQARK